MSKISEKKLKSQFKKFTKSPKFKNKILINKLKNGIIAINDFRIVTHQDISRVTGPYVKETFYSKKAALGFTVNYINQDRATAKLIKSMDRKIEKYYNDCVLYAYSLETSLDLIQRKTLKIRLEDASERLKQLRFSLKETVKKTQIS